MTSRSSRLFVRQRAATWCMRFLYAPLPSCSFRTFFFPMPKIATGALRTWGACPTISAPDVSSPSHARQHPHTRQAWLRALSSPGPQPARLMPLQRHSKKNLINFLRPLVYQIPGFTAKTECLPHSGRTMAYRPRSSMFRRTTDNNDSAVSLRTLWNRG